MNRHNMTLRTNGCFNKTRVLAPTGLSTIGTNSIWRETGIQRSLTKFFYIRKPLKKGYFNGCSSSVAGYARFSFGIVNRV
jgi:hypothetical protein